MVLIHSAVEYLKKNPRCNYSYWVSCLYSFIGRNSINIGRHNTLKRRNTYLKHCRIEVNGNGNTIDFGEGASFLSNSKIYIKGNDNIIKLGERNVFYDADLYIEDDGNTIEFGDKNRIFGQTHVAAIEGTRIEFGNGCLFSSGVVFRTGDSHAIMDSSTNERINPSKNIIVHDHVWFGNAVIVLKDVIIGHDSVIGTGSVVTKSVGSNTIVAGNPAHIVKNNVTWGLHRKYPYNRDLE